MTSRKNRYDHKTKHLSKELLTNDYIELKSLRKIAQKHNVHHNTISNLFTKYNIDYKQKIIYSKNENIFSEETDEAFYLAGFIAADGNLYKNYLNIWLSLEDEDHLNKIKNILKTDMPTKIRENHKSSFNEREVISSTKGFCLYSKQIYNDLIKKFNLKENKSLTLEFSKHLIDHPLVHHFIRGYFDGDGSFSKRNPNVKNKQSKINICFELTGTENFIEIVNKILHNNIDLPNNKVSKTKNLYRIRYSGNRLSALIGDWLYKDATIYLERKYQRYLMAKQYITDLDHKDSH